MLARTLVVGVSALSWALLLLGLAACGSDPVELSEEPPDEPAPPVEEPAPPLAGVVIATDTIDIAPVPVPTIGDPDFLIPRKFVGDLPLNLEPTTGKLLVLSVREVLAGLPCPSRNFVTECGTMVVLEQDGPIPGRRPGRLTVSGPDPVTYYPWSDFTLVPRAQDI